jgi:hypothetical protein
MADEITDIRFHRLELVSREFVVRLEDRKTWNAADGKGTTE